jgi:transposase InsO family protein
LRGPATWTDDDRYDILDVFSRAVVGWMIAAREDAAVAETLIAETGATAGIVPQQLTMHADRGSAMPAQVFAHVLADLGVTGCPRGVPQSAARIQRQSGLRGGRQNAEVPPKRAGSLGQSDRCPRVGTTVLALVHP